MNEINKPNDMFAAILQAPDVNEYDLVKSDILPENTQLLNKDFYKSSEVVQEMFKNEDGTFNELAFNNAYLRAAEVYSTLGNDQQLAKALEWDPYDYTAPIEGKHYDVRPVVMKDRNPFKELYSRTSINSIDTNDLSLRELAQQGKVFDTEKNEWLDKSANELSFFDKFFKNTLVYAKYDEDTIEVDKLTNQTITHKKGDWKFDEDGNLYVETLGKREMYGKEIVNPLDLITVDGSAFNRIDFFDSDGKTKSIAGTTAKLLVEIAPFLIPGVREHYGKYKMAMGLSYVLPTFYKAIEGIFTGDVSAGNETALWKAMNSTQGYLAKYNQRGVSDESAGSLFNYEQLTNLVSDVYSQIYEQRAAASFSKLFYKEKDLEYIEGLKGVAEKQLKGLSVMDDLTGVARTEQNYAKIAQKAANKIGELNEIAKKRSRLAKDLNLTYMAMTQSEQVYGEALAGGYDRRTAGAAALLSAAGQFALMRNNPLGDWFLDKSVGYNAEKSGMIKAYNAEIAKKFPDLQKAINQLGTNKVEGRHAIGKIFSGVKDKFKNYINDANTFTTAGANMSRNAVIEGIEEVSEQAVMDMTKGVVDFLSYLGMTGKQGSFGGFDVVFSKSGFENYLANFVGGTIGGALFEFDRSVISGNAISKDVQYSVIDYVSNGKSKEFLEVAKEQSKRFASETLSAVATDINGEKIYLGAENGNSQSEFIYKSLEGYVNNIERILNSEEVNNNNESWVRKAIIDEIKVQDMLKNNTDSFIISDVRELVDQIVTLKASIELAEAKKEDPTTQLAKLKEVKAELDEIQEGKKADYYYGLSLFSLNRNLHSPFLSLSVDDYTLDKYKKEFRSLPKAEQDVISAEFKSIMEDDGQFKYRMKAAYNEFMKQNEVFSKSLEDYGKDGYNALRTATFNALYAETDLLAEAVKNKDLDALKKVWAKIHSANSALIETGINNMELNSSIGINLGKFLIDQGFLSAGLSNQEIADILNVDIEEVEENLFAQALLTRLEKEGFNFNSTIQDLKNIVDNKQDTSLLEEEKALLEKTIIKNNEGSLDTKISEIYKPEVFNDIDPANLQDADKEDLAEIINSRLLNFETVETSILDKIFTGINAWNSEEIKRYKNELSTADVDDLESLNELSQGLEKSSNRKSLRINTNQKVLNKRAFVNNNLNNFYGILLDALAEANFTVNGSPLSEVLDELRQKGTLNKDILGQIIGYLSISSENEAEILQDLISDLSESVFDVTTMDNKAFSELLQVVIDVLKKSSSNPQTAELFNKEFNNFLTMLFVNDINSLDASEFNPATNEIIRNSGLLMNNVMGKYQVYTDIYSKDDTSFISPVAQLLADFAEDIMRKGEKLDHEVLEAAKVEASKLNLGSQNNLGIHSEKLLQRLKVIIDYGNTQRNTLLDKLREVQITIYNEGKVSKSAFKLLEELNKEISQFTSPTDIKINTDTVELINKALSTINMVRGIISAMATTNVAMDVNTLITEDVLYGYNVNFNKMYAKNDISTVLGILSSSDVVILSKELDLIENKLEHFKLIAEYNSGSTIEGEKKIKTAILDSLWKRFSSLTDNVGILKLSFNGDYLLTEKDVNDVSNEDSETKIIILEHKARENFLKMVDKNKGNIHEVLDGLFAPFKNDEYKIGNFNLLDNRDSILSPTMTTFEVKDWYVYLHSVLAMSSVEFVKIYKNYLEKELSLSENFKAPFFSQQLIMRLALSYSNGEEGKSIMSHIVSFIVPHLEEKITTKDPAEFEKEFINSIVASNGLPLNWLYFIRGTSGTGKSDVLANFIVWTLIQQESQLLGEKLDIVSLAPTEKTKAVLEKSISRNLGSINLKTETVEDFIESLFKDDTTWLDRNAAVKESTIEKGQIEFRVGKSNLVGPTGIFIADDTAVFSKETLDSMFSNFVNNTPKLVVIDEASKINSLQYQILNYLAQYKNYYVIVLGDDLQEGTTIGKSISSLENLYMPTSVKLKSTIRAENNHKNDNNIALEQFVSSVNVNRFLNSKFEVKPIILKYSLFNNKLNGDRFIDKLSVNELRTLDTTKEIVFITNDGTLTDDEKNIIKLAFGDSYLNDIKVLPADVQGQEFDQVVILADLTASNQEKNKEITLNTAKKTYTLLTRAKVGTLIVGANKLITDFVIPEQKDTTSDKSLDMAEIKQFLIVRDEEIKAILSNIVSMNLTTTKASDVSNKDPEDPEKLSKEEEREEEETKEVVEIVEDVEEEQERAVESNFTEEDDEPSKPLTVKDVSDPISPSEGIETEIPLSIEKKDSEDDQSSEVKKEIAEDDNFKKEIKDHIAQASPKKSLDVKIIGYSFYNNLGKDLPSNIQDADQIRAWINNLGPNLTDFAGYIHSIKGDLLEYSDSDLVDVFAEKINSYIKYKNNVFATVLNFSALSNTNGVVPIETINGGTFNINLKTDPYVMHISSGYSQSYGQKTKKEIIDGNQFFLVVDIDGLPTTISILSSEATALNEEKNFKGKNKADDSELKDFYLKLKKSNKTPINLMGNLHLLSGVKTILEDGVKLELDADKDSIERMFPGATVVKYGAFRGPSFDINGNLNQDSVNSFMTQLQNELNIYNKTQIKIVDGSRQQGAREKGTEPYQKYMFRPYVIISYSKEGKNFEKMVLLYPRKRKLKQVWNDLDILEQSKNFPYIIAQKSLLMNKYQGWKIVEEFILTEMQKTGNYEEIINWLWNIFNFGSLLSSAKPGKDDASESNFIRSQKATNLFKTEFSKWDPKKSSLADFITSNSNLQKLFKGITRGFNPVYFIHSYINNQLTSDAMIDSFKNFIENSTKDVYYNLRIESLELSTEHGAAFGNFDPENAKNYFMAYYVQSPDALVDLRGINQVKTSTETKTKARSANEESLQTKFKVSVSNKILGVFKPNSEIVTVDISNYGNIMNILNNPEIPSDQKSEQFENLKNFINKSVQMHLLNHYGFRPGVEEEEDEDFTKESISKNTSEALHKILSDLNNKSNSKISIGSIIESNTSICKTT